MTTTLMTYNLFEGAHQSYSQLVDFIKSSNVDILCLQEVNEWQNDDFATLKDFASQCGFSHHVFGNSNTEFKLATLSRHPILSHYVHTEGFWHSLVETRISIGSNELAVFNLHLNPKWEGPRKEEVKKLLTLIDTDAPTLLVGDFNSISRQDDYRDSLLSELQSHGITKFGRDELEFSVTDMLGAAGLIDVAAKLGNMTVTVPSAFNKDKNHEVPLRLDYVFASQPAANSIESIKVIKNDITDAISDHYPILVSLAFVQPE